MAIAEGIIRKNLPVRFECETRLDSLDKELIDLLHRAGLRALTFGVESVDPNTLKRVGRRPIPPEHQKDIISYCNKKGIMTVGFYVIGFLTDTIESIQATIDYSIDLNSTMALFKILTPYPGTPLRKRMESLITETDLEKFDGYTPTFKHPNLTHDQLLFMLTTAYSRFYIRPSWGWNYLGLPGCFAKWVQRWDAYAQRRQHEIEMAYFTSQEPKAIG
jgi:anaerobic magnesium-protoporphyrin IX monomethyl ester cyclase